MSFVAPSLTKCRLNPTVEYRAHTNHLTPGNAEDIVAQYDIVLDCTDHPTSRYLISDICVLLKKPLVSASAFQTSGQLLVLSSPPGAGPCYRCVFPKPPPPESVVGCGEGGIVGPVVGTMGVLQALEAIKLIARGGLETQENPEPADRIAMLLFSAMTETPFRTVRMRGKRKGCFACGAEEDGLTLEKLKNSLDYVQFCGIVQPVKGLNAEERVSATAYKAASKDTSKTHVLIDVRGKEQFSVANLAGSVNVPVSRFMSSRAESASDLLPVDVAADTPIYLVCRVGNDSQIAAKKLKELGLDNNGSRFIGDIEGGLKAWKRDIDPSLPFI